MNRKLVGVAVVACIGLAACGDSGDEPSDAADATGSAGSDLHDLLPDRIADAGRIVVGNSPVYPPMSFTAEGSDERQGFDVELGEALAEALGLDIEWTTQPYEQYIPSLTTGRIDLILSAMQDLPDRRETVDFVDYYLTGPQLFALPDVAAELPDAVAACGRSVVVDRGDVGYQAALTEFSTAECAPAGADELEQVPAGGTPDALIQLDQGRADLGIQGAESIRYMVTELDPGKYELIGEPITQIPVGMGVKKGEDELRDALVAALRQLMENGTYQEIGERWGIQDILVDEVTVNGETVG